MLAVRAASRFYHLRFSRKGRLELGPRAQWSSACASSVAVPRMLAFGLTAMESSKVVEMLSPKPCLEISLRTAGRTTARQRPPNNLLQREAGR